MDSVEWGEGQGVGTDGRGGSAAGPLSSVCALVILSMGGCYAWVACRPWVGVVGWGHGALFAGAGLSGGLVHGGGLFMGAGLFFMGTVVTCCLLWGQWLARAEGTRVGVLTIDDSEDNNDKRRHHHRPSFSCHVAEGDVAPPNCPCSCALSCRLWAAGLIRGCWFVLCGHGGDVSWAVWSVVSESG